MQAQLDDEEDDVVVVRQITKKGSTAAHAQRNLPVNGADDHEAEDAPFFVSPCNAVIDLVSHPSDDGPAG